MPIQPDSLRNIMRAWATGVCVVTTAHDGQRHGLTVSSFTSVSLEPPRILFSINKESRTYPLLIASRSFAVCMLHHEQIAVSNRFAGRDTEHTDRFEGYTTTTGVTGVPILQDCLAYLECRIVSELDSVTNAIILAEVIAGQRNDGSPLLYWNRNYRAVEAPE